MQKLFENWRKFKKHQIQLKEALPGAWMSRQGAAAKDRDWQRLAAQDPDAALRQRKLEKERALNVVQQALEKTGITLVMLADPTGVTGYPELARASKLVYNEPTLMHAGGWFLALLGALPGFSAAGGGARVAGRAVNAAKVVDNAGDVSRVLRNAGGRRHVRLADEIDDETRRARREMAQAGKELKGAAAGAARASSNIAGTSAKVATNKIGKKSGVFVEDGRAMVNVDTPQGPVTFIFSSGESMQAVNPKTGMIEPSPRVWFPAGAQEAGGRYKKYAPPGRTGASDIPDARFGAGNEKIWNSLVRPLPDNWDPSEIQRYYESRSFKNTGILHPSDLRRMGDGLGSASPDKYLTDKFGFGWAKKIGQSSELDDKVDWLIQTGYFMRITDPRSNYKIGKYASPDSEFGKIAAYLEKLSPNGNPTDELINVFGPVTTGRGPDSYNAWRRGEWYVGSPVLNREHLDIFKRWRKIAL